MSRHWHYPPMGYKAFMVFIEQKSFMRVRDDLLTEEDLRHLQSALIIWPDYLA